jgi:hypothetical protein
MADLQDNLTTANALLKIRYSPNLTNAISEINILQKRVDFNLSQTGLGQKYIMPFLGGREQGITFLGQTDSNNTLNPSAPPTFQYASLVGSAIAVNATVTQQIIDASAQPEVSFYPIVDMIMENLIISASKQVEVSMLHGATGLCDVLSCASNTSTTATLNIDPATWAGAMWTGEDGVNGKQLDAYDAVGLSGGVATGTKVNTNAALQVTQVIQSNTAPQLVVSGNSSDITALVTACDSSSDNVVLFAYGAFNKEMVGLTAIQENTGSLFNIDASTTSLWKANQFPITGNLTASVLNDAVSTAVNVGALDENVTVMVNPYTWSKLMNTALTAQRRFDDSYSPKIIANGTRELEFVSQNGTMEIVAHPYAHQGVAHILPFNQLVRIGSSELKLLSNAGRGSNNVGDLLWPITDTVNYQIKSWTNQALMVKEPAKTVLITGIVNS